VHVIVSFFNLPRKLRFPSQWSRQAPFASFAKPGDPALQAASAVMVLPFRFGKFRHFPKETLYTFIHIHAHQLRFQFINNLCKPPLFTRHCMNHRRVGEIILACKIIGTFHPIDNTHLQFYETKTSKQHQN